MIRSATALGSAALLRRIATAAQPRADVAVANAAAQPLGYGLQKLIADDVAERSAPDSAFSRPTAPSRIAW